jgi:hypothetical protein
MSDYAINLAETVEVITCWDWDKCMDFVTLNPTEMVMNFIKENW